MDKAENKLESLQQGQVQLLYLAISSHLHIISLHYCLVFLCPLTFIYCRMQALTVENLIAH